MRNTQIDSIVRAAQRTPWAILPDKLFEIAAFLERRTEGRESALPGERFIPQATRVGSVAVIPIQGTIFPKANLMMDFSGGTSAEMLSSQVREAANDRGVSSILLDIDSPGGTVDGVPEAGEEIRRARESKRIVASVNASAASAAYWLGSQATEIAITPSGDVGSIGVFAMHQDWSEFDRKAGVKTTFIHAGRYKVEGNPFEPLTEETRAHIQEQVDEFREMFIDAVAAGREMSAFQVRKRFGEYSEGRMALARKAKDIGMVDRVESRDMTLSRLLKRGQTGSARAAIGTVRDFEAFLREEGFSKQEALTLAARGKDCLDLSDSGPSTGRRDAGETDNAADEVALREAGDQFRGILIGDR